MPFDTPMVDTTLGTLHAAMGMVHLIVFRMVSQSEAGSTYITTILCNLYGCPYRNSYRSPTLVGTFVGAIVRTPLGTLAGTLMGAEP